jgi:hypothetical protein
LILLIFLCFDFFLFLDLPGFPWSLFYFPYFF